jgi:hypothetical protein
MTDEEIICTWMEPKPKGGIGYENRWWTVPNNPGMRVSPVYLTLNILHKVEARLTDEQAWRYDEALAEGMKSQPERGSSIFVWHADAPTRIKALAQVLRPEVDK